jgi:dissimilatory sulfite reductase (desulfoviridin) alpha/beta subunit
MWRAERIKGIYAGIVGTIRQRLSEMDAELRKDRRYTVRVDREIEDFFNAHTLLNISDFIRKAIRNEIAGFNEQDYERLVNEYEKALEEVKKYVH